MTIDVVAIVLSLVALIVTVVGFFASLKFYREGTVIQQSVRDLLAAVSEKTASIESQVGGMFEKTLDAAIGRTPAISGASQQQPPLRGDEAETVPAGEDGGAPAPAKLPVDVMQLLAFEGLRLTDVSGGLAGTIFRLGSPHGFNLFDGQRRILFLGYFPELRPVEVVARTKFLLENIDKAWKAVL